MKKLNGNLRMVKQMNENVRELGYCSECGETIFDDMEDVYVNEDGRYFCCTECAMAYYGLTKLEF